METLVQESTALVYYVYGVIAEQELTLPDLPAVEPGAPVLCVREGDLGAVVTPLPVDRFDPELLEERLADLTWLEPRVRAHQEVLAAIAGPVAPLRFGTIFRDEAGVRTMLRTNAPMLRAALERLRGRREWGVKIYAEPKQVAEYVRTNNDQVANLIMQRNRMSSGAAYMLQKKLDALILQESRQLANICVCESQARLAGQASATAGGPVSQSAGDGMELIFSGAYLVDEATFDQFLAEVEALVAHYSSFRFELTGPWPAYSFAAAPQQESDHV
ncbi:GvpL/GvpF family gas vesicle protein [Candidatus Oscillochloris fontis]|uniref:GvpL/GvpF family gas vesicle protein n=1 Tax=Candidatus Oscillochloris fontis TaxID=2496868 RepID=UPI00101BED74|nr:GvpL/GvpF family gas vesicle protein [Candidatus Oscillochloris fontis]